MAEAVTGWDAEEAEEVLDVAQEQPVPELFPSSWRLRNVWSDSDTHEQGPTLSKRETFHSETPSCKTWFEDSMQNCRDFRSAARNMLESLVSDHERILAQCEARLRLEHAQRARHESRYRSRGKEGLDPGELPHSAAAENSPEHSEDGDAADVGPSAHRADSQAFSLASEDAMRHARASRGQQSSVVSEDYMRHMRASRGSSMARQRRSIMRLTVGSMVSDVPITWKMTADVVINQASSKFMTKQRSFRGYEHARPKLIFKEDVIVEDIIEAFMGCAIVLDMIALGLSTRFSHSWSGWWAVDALFAIIFTLDMLRKVFLLGYKGYMCGTHWRRNISELLLVILTWTDVGVATSKLEDSGDYSNLTFALRLLRVARVVRIFRTRVFCELLMMVNGVIGSYRTLLYSLVLISLPLYCVALGLTEALGSEASNGRGAEKFEQLEDALFTVFRCFVASDCTQEDGKPLFVLVTKAYGWAYGVLYCVVQFLMTFGLYNVITAIYVENSVCAAKFNDLAVKRMRFQDRQYFEEKAQAMLEVIWQLYFEREDKDKRDKVQKVEFDFEAAGRLRLSREFFEELCKQPSFIKILRSLDISEDDQMDLFETLDIEGRGTIDLMSLVIGVGKLRGEARKADIVSMGLILRSLQHKLLQIESRLRLQSHVSFVSGGAHSNKSSQVLKGRYTYNTQGTRGG